MTNFENATKTANSLIDFATKYQEEINKMKYYGIEPAWCQGRECQGFAGNCRKCIEDWLREEAK